MFNNKEYWKRRKAGKRGQGDKPVDKVEEVEGEHMVRTPKGFERVNRKQSRSHIKSTPATKKNYRHQVKRWSFRHTLGKRIELNKPEGTNHERHIARRLAREGK